MASNRKQPRSFVLLCGSRRNSRSLQSASAGMQLPSPGSRRQSGFHAVARAALANDGQLRLNVSAGGGGAAGKTQIKTAELLLLLSSQKEVHTTFLISGSNGNRSHKQLQFSYNETEKSIVVQVGKMISLENRLSPSFNPLSTFTRQK